MNLQKAMQRHKDLTITKPKVDREVICPYCQRQAELVTGQELFPGNKPIAKRLFWLCARCDAYVGTHQRSISAAPLGTLANASLRKERTKAHKIFDQLWQKGAPLMTRNGAYHFMAYTMGIPKAAAHIALFNEQQCQEISRIVEHYLNGVN
ncbi:hypothetical protein S0112_096 [Shewanella phage S0112]|nr:hypothetical protein S0112_096 [Shewanella phage S0112]